ncbi:MAG: transposase [Acidobacteriota bacterium]
MTRPLRYFQPGSLIEVTTRTLQGRLLLRPGAALTQIIHGILGRAQSLYGLPIHAIVVLSNHYHLLCSPADPQQLARFMCFFNSNLAREAGRLHAWRDKFWSRRYQAIPVSAELAAQLARFKYLLSHGAKEGFVLTPGDWPGVHCVDALLEGKPLRGLWFDRSAEYEARRRGLEVSAHDFAAEETVTLSPLPCWRHLTASQTRARVADLLQEIEQDARRLQRASGREPLGADFIQRQNPHQEPLRSKRAPAPLVHAATKKARRALLDAYRIFVSAYRRAAESLRNGDLSAVFPEHCFPPPLPFARGPAAAPAG